VQLIISLGMMFCAAVFIKQVHFLHQQPDLLINRSNVAFVRALTCRPLRPHWIDQIKQIPGIVDVIPTQSVWNFVNNIFPMVTLNFVDSTGNSVSALINNRREDPRFFEFFGMDVVQGTVYPGERRDIGNEWFVLNETAMKEAGEHLSKSPYFMGVVQDIYITPTAKVMPVRFFYPPLGDDERATDRNYFYAMAYKYEEGMRSQTHEAVTQWYHNECPDQNLVIEFDYTEDLYNVHFKSERALLTLLSVMTLACILIAVFGVYSLTSLTCQQRKKEIAIRKINGAEVVDIMNIFFKEYLVLLVIAAVVAFPAGYIIMKRWLAGYVKQTSIDAWLFILIFLVVLAVVLFSIISMVWKAAHQNPAKVMKSE
jgi:hypothetical protein